MEIDEARIIEAAEKAYCEKSYEHFFRVAWSVLEPDTKLVWNWHIGLLCRFLQKKVEQIARNEPKSRDVVINIPPRSLKSSIVTIFLNAWAWTRWPHLKFVTASYSAKLAEDHAMKTRKLIESDWYQNYWKLPMRRDQNKVSTFENLHGGFRKAVGVGGSVTGVGGDIIIADDPIKPSNAYSEVFLKRCREWWDLVFQNRLNNHQVGLRLIVMQRLHERDLTGHVLGKRHKKWQLVRIPGESGYPIEPDHLRTNYKNGLFFPKRLTKEDLEKFKEDYGMAGYAGQIGQSPAPVDGDIFKRDWVSRYKELPYIEFPLWRQSWDLSFKAGSNSSYVVGQTWVSDGMRHWLVDVVRRKMSFVETRKAVLAFIEKWPDVQVVLVEDKANGPGIIDDLKEQISEIEAVGKSRSKEENAHAASVLFEAGKVFVPEGVVGDEFVNELLTFPHGAYDDQVDAATQYLIYAKQNHYSIHGMTLW